MSRSVKLVRWAQFGKIGGMDDYAWRQNALPDWLNELGQQMAEYSGQDRAVVSCVAFEQSTLWGAGVCPQGPDSAGRAVVGLAVVQVVDAPGMKPADWVPIATALLRQALVEQVTEQAETCIEISEGRIEEAIVQEDLERAVLGLPLGVDEHAAVDLLRCLPARFRGVIVVPHRAQAIRLRRQWPAGLLPVNFVQPALSQADMELIGALRGLSLTQREMRDLGGMPCETARHCVQLVGGLDPERRLTPVAVADREAEWLVDYRARHQQGAKLIAVLRKDFGGAALPEAVVRRVVPTGSDRVRALLRQTTGSTRDVLGLADAEELGASGFLTTDAIAPLAAWTHLVEASPRLRDAAIARLESEGLTSDEAAFVLDLPGPDPAIIDVLGGRFGNCVDAALRLKLPVPMRRLRQWFQASADESQLLRSVGAVRRYGPWVAAIGDAAVGRMDAEFAVLQDEDLAAVARLRARLSSSWPDPARLLASLLVGGRMDEAMRLLREVFPSLGVFPRSVLDLLAARLGTTGSALVADADLLDPLLAMGLVRAQDVIPANSRVLLELCDRWPETEGLVAVFRGVDRIPDRLIPESWLDACRSAVDPTVTSSWVRVTTGQRRQEAIDWLAWLRPAGFPVDVLTPRPVVAPDGQDMTGRNVSWLRALVPLLPRAEQLQALGRVVASRRSLDEEKATHLAAVFCADTADADQALVEYVLTRIGPMPSIEGVAPALIAVLVPNLDPIALLDAVMNLRSDWIDRAPDVARVVVDAIRALGHPYPDRGYSRRQRNRHPVLCADLARLPGWTAISPDQTARTAYARRLLTLVDVGACDAGGEPAQSGSPGPLDHRKSEDLR